MILILTWWYINSRSSSPAALYTAAVSDAVTTEQSGIEQLVDKWLSMDVYRQRNYCVAGGRRAVIRIMEEMK